MREMNERGKDNKRKRAVEEEDDETEHNTNLLMDPEKIDIHPPGGAKSKSRTEPDGAKSFSGRGHGKTKNKNRKKKMKIQSNEIMRYLERETDLGIPRGFVL